MKLEVLPAHGRLPCVICYPPDEAKKPWGYPKYNWPGWQLTHNPLSWGSQTPEVLVLGFSKGVNQNADILSRRHEDIPFRRGRHNLTKILQSLGLLAAGERVDARFSAGEEFFAFGSLLRCSIAMADPRTGKLIMSGSNIMPETVNNQDTRRVFDNCIDQFLTRLPANLRLVVMLGNDVDYIDGCIRMLSQAHRSLQRINEIGYRSERVTWVHTIHFAAQGRLVPEWCGERGQCKQAQKGEQARRLVRDLGLGPAARAENELLFRAEMGSLF